MRLYRTQPQKVSISGFAHQFMKNCRKVCYLQCKQKLKHCNQQKYVLGFTLLEMRDLLSMETVKTISNHHNFHPCITGVLYKGC